MVYVVRSVNFIYMDPLLYFLCCEIGSLIGCSAMWNALLVDKLFCEFIDNGAGRNIMSSKGYSFSEYVNIPIRMNLCPLNDGRVPV